MNCPECRLDMAGTHSSQERVNDMGCVTNETRVPAEGDIIREALRQVIDPEVGVNIVDLGLVYRIDRDASGVRIELTMTSPACPMGDLLLDEAHEAAAAATPAGLPVDIELVWEPPWEPAMMSDAAREILGWADV
jgi:metal-sulfur cluster biosynthetic enzyme